MAGKNNNYYTWSDWLRDLRYYGAIGALAMMVPLTLGSILLLSPSSNAADNWEVEGTNGTLYIHGALTESACRLEMTSARQEVALGDIGTAQLKYIGARGIPVKFELRLTDCLRSPARSMDARFDSITWSDDQPAVTVSFNAIRDTDNPRLIKAMGVSGFGLSLEDAWGQNVSLGDRGSPLMLTSGNNTLHYKITPERTPAELRPGYYQALVRFQLNYE